MFYLLWNISDNFIKRVIITSWPLIPSANSSDEWISSSRSHEVTASRSLVASVSRRCFDTNLLIKRFDIRRSGVCDPRSEIARYSYGSCGKSVTRASNIDLGSSTEEGIQVETSFRW
jgi:hypothetical protein